jgi:hypothetical protein
MGTSREFLNAKEASEYLRLSPRSLARLPVPKIHLGRRVVYQLDDLVAYATANKQVTAETASLPKPNREVITKLARRVGTPHGGGSPEARYQRRLALLSAA